MADKDEQGDADKATLLLARTDAMPKGDFMARTTSLPTDRVTRSAKEFGGWGEAYQASYEDDILKGTPLRDAAYGPLTAYMLRRFGTPSQSADLDKHLMAG